MSGSPLIDAGDFRPFVLVPCCCSLRPLLVGVATDKVLADEHEGGLACGLCEPETCPFFTQPARRRSSTDRKSVV